ncbi:MAG: hypothetical protein ABGX07_08490 [Pirellulaceae bacterium]|nr:hypothetical protein [Planctomycetaceae bacterium]HIM29622.1 hypothetical protein [Planctomycetota bacterium]
MSGRVTLTIDVKTPMGAPKFVVRYVLEENSTSLLVENRIQNESNTVNEFGFRDMLRGDRTFKFGTDVDDRLTWAHGEWFHQSHGVYSETAGGHIQAREASSSNTFGTETTRSGSGPGSHD